MPRERGSVSEGRGTRSAQAEATVSQETRTAVRLEGSGMGVHGSESPDGFSTPGQRALILPPAQDPSHFPHEQVTRSP
ncbi:hypothetical protein GCM10009564_13580 [Streptomyces thermogriseus]|uniref:Uncharacterized protein n=1 Tax=Streptomyces thermogriseus TaxID=75292 RepID=A0ABN1SW32_9ACTN